jgi:hypothetical protein
VDTNSIPNIIYPLTTEQVWFIPPAVDSTFPDNQGNMHDTTFYRLSDRLTCSTNYGGWIDNTTEYNDILEEMIDCFLGADSVMIDCITDTGNGYGGTIDGFTFESINADLRFSATFGNRNGRIVLREMNGTFSPGLYRINIFAKNGLIVPKYQELGVAPAIVTDVDINITPNPIVNSTLVFNVETNQDVNANIIVRKLDGTIIHSESVCLEAQSPLSRSIPVRGTIPYKQVVVSVELQDGTIMQETALTE